MNSLLSELFDPIFNNFNSDSSINQILNLRTISKYFLFIIHNISLINVQIFLKSDDICRYVLNMFKFKNLHLSNAYDVNSFIDKLRNCHTVNLSMTNVSDES